MVNLIQATSYSVLFGIYLLLSKKQLNRFWKQCKNFSIKRCMGFIEYTYCPISYHWFYQKEEQGSTTWQPFSLIDSLALEEASNSPGLSSDTVIATDGGRFDVNILCRTRTPVYWEAAPSVVRRCSWFYEANNSNYIPYQEYMSELLENEYRRTFESKQWGRKIHLPNGDVIVFNQPDYMYIVPPANQSTDEWGNISHTDTNPRQIKRGIDGFDIDKGEEMVIDHLMFVVHGIGSACDLNFRTIEEVTNDLRRNSIKLIQSHFQSSVEKNLIRRIEILPINWHMQLHSQVDKHLQDITLPSVPLLRRFINDTLSDILLYKSSKYCQSILTVVGTELNRLYKIFIQRNPSFSGSVSLAGHSLGSAILFDLLCYQQTPIEPEITYCDGCDQMELIDIDTDTVSKYRQLSPRFSSMLFDAGIREAHPKYPQLNFNPIALFALGSPIGMFITTKGLTNLGRDFCLPTCPTFYNIFHPYDVVANRIESLVNPQFLHRKPVVIPHYNGGKRIHLKIREKMAKVKADLKEKWKSSVNSTWKTISTTNTSNIGDNLQQSEQMDIKLEGISNTEDEVEEDIGEINLKWGLLNKGRRIDYVLQEAPIESFNEYLFAMTLSSHVGYWQSEDAMLFMLKEIYGTMGIAADDDNLKNYRKVCIVDEESSSVESNTFTNISSDTVVSSLKEDLNKN